MGKRLKPVTNQQNTSSKAPYDESGPFNFRLAGLAVQLSWLYLLLYSGGWNPALSFTRAAGSTDTLYLLSTAALCIVLLVGIWRIKPFMQFSRSWPMRVAAPALAMLGTLSYCLIGGENPGLAVAGGVFTGVGSAFLWARWAGVFGNVRPREVIGVCPLVVAVAVLVCFTVGYLDPLLQAALVVLLPGASGAWLVLAEGEPDVGAADSPRVQRSARRHYAPLVAFASFLGFATGLLPAFSFGDAFASYDLIFYSGVAVFCLIFVAAAIFADDRRNFALLFLAPTVVMLCVLVPFSHFASSNPVVAIMGPLGSIAFELFLLIGSVLFARMTDHSPARAYLITRFSMSVFDVLGLACGNAIMGQTASNTAMQIAAVVMFLITEVFIAVLAFAYFSNRKGVLGNSPLQHAPSNAATLSQLASPAEATPAGAAPAEASPSETSPASANAAACSSSVSPFPSTSTSPSAPSLVTELDGYSCHEPTGAPKSAPDSASVAELEAYSCQSQATIPSLAQRCQQLGQQHGLSARELDVLELVAQGRSYARIREDLSISQGTVNYHMSNLYAKLGVHSRQEVIDLVQAPTANKSSN